MEKFDITVVGAGVIGLAITAEISSSNSSVLLLEKNKKFGQETSSRNSEVIHGGIYYPEDSLKAQLCVRGNRLLYETCSKYNIPHKKCGKLIIAVKDEEIRSIENLKIKAENNGVRDLQFLDGKDIRKIEPHIKAVAGLFSPSTGIIDSHSLMVHLLSRAEAKGVMVMYGTSLIGLEHTEKGWLCRISEADGSEFSFYSNTVINAAGLASGEIARMAGLNYKIHYCKGEYFQVGNGKSRFIRGLVYPSPAYDLVSLGIHTVVDLAGGLKLGPNAYYVDKIDYSFDPEYKESFYENTKSFLPFLKREDLFPDMTGIRPKLQGPGESVKDFIIKAEEGDFSGLINLIGIESPGLTSCLAIARKVAELYQP